MSILENGVKQFKDMTTVEKLRNNLQPRGTSKVVQLHLGNHGVFDGEFIAKCLDELERMPIRNAVGDLPTNLEKLAYQLLRDSAYITFDDNVN